MGVAKLYIPEHVLDNARRLRSLGTPWAEISRRVGYAAETLRCRLDESYRIRRNERSDRIRSLKKEYFRRNYTGFSYKSDDRAITTEELRARKALIPPDTRSLTARLLGDPIPGDPRRAP